MKTQFVVWIFLAAASLSNVILFVSCEPDNLARLHIENGYYADLPSTGVTGSRFAIQFEYFVTGRQCQVGGYGIKYDSSGGVTNWYKLQTLTPNTRYTISDTFACSRTLTTNPNVTMQGYRIGDSESYPELKAQSVLPPNPL
jgi:hypothetical protein